MDQKNGKPAAVDEVVASASNRVRQLFREAFEKLSEEEQGIFDVRLRKKKIDFAAFIQGEIAKARGT